MPASRDRFLDDRDRPPCTQLSLSTICHLVYARTLSGKMGAQEVSLPPRNCHQETRMDLLRVWPARLTKVGAGAIQESSQNIEAERVTAPGHFEVPCPVPKGLPHGLFGWHTNESVSPNDVPSGTLQLLAGFRPMMVYVSFVTPRLESP